MSPKKKPRLQHLTDLSQGISKRKHHLLPALNGLIGDKLPKNHPLTIKMSLRHASKDVSIDDLNLKKRLKGNGQNLIVFVHGLMLDELCWQIDSEQMPGYGTLLEQDLGHTALYIRYNSGLHISQNGKALTKLLQKIMDLYGPQIKTLRLVGYSMGGLIVRSAGHYGKALKHSWIEKLVTVILIGTPDSGSHWEQLGHLISFILKTIWNFQTRLIGKVIDQRSNGIKDLRFGFMVDEDWQHKNAAKLLHFKRTILPPLAGVQYHILAGTLSKDEMSPMASYFGDGLVSKRSAMSKNHFQVAASRISLGDYKVFPRTGHFQLLKSQEIYAYLKNIFMKRPTSAPGSD